MSAKAKDDAAPIDIEKWVAELDEILHDIAAGHTKLDRSHAAKHLNDLRGGRVTITASK